MDLMTQVTVPAGERGNWRIEKFEITKRDADFANMRAAITGRYRESVNEGVYTKLMRGGCLVMSDTRAEMRDHMTPVIQARGHILINGLGIGMVLAACLRKPDVTKATVVEIDPDVIGLVGPHYTDSRVEIINADALTYKLPKGARYGMVWHDIWDTICGDNIPQMKALHRKYGRYADWQGSWCRYECERRT